MSLTVIALFVLGLILLVGGAELLVRPHASQWETRRWTTGHSSRPHSCKPAGVRCVQQTQAQIGDGRYPLDPPELSKSSR